MSEPQEYFMLLGRSGETQYPYKLVGQITKSGNSVAATRNLYQKSWQQPATVANKYAT